MGKTLKQKTKKKSSTRKKHDSTNPYVADPGRKITVTVNWDSPDRGLSDLRNKRVFRFITKNLAEGYNLIQTQQGSHFFAHGKTQLKLQAIKVEEWPMKIKWWEKDPKRKDEKQTLKCSAYNEWIKQTPCAVGAKREKVFFKFKSNEYVGGFATYLWRLFSGEVDEKMHKEFVKALKLTFKKKPIFIHNTDVSWLHAKEKKI